MTCQCGRQFRGAYPQPDGTVLVVRPSRLCMSCWAARNLRPKPLPALSGAARAVYGLVLLRVPRGQAGAVRADAYARQEKRQRWWVGLTCRWCKRPIRVKDADATFHRFPPGRPWGEHHGCKEARTAR